MTIDLSDLSPAETQYYLQHVIAPRPICFASTINKKGESNLSPFSFFNMFSANPPIVIFSPARRIRDNSTKHTLENVLEVPEVVINIVTYDMVQQTSLASCDYPRGVDEFVKAGFTRIPATLVSPYMVAESKAKLECEVVEVKSVGETGGAGNLVICKVLMLHIDDGCLTGDAKIDQTKLELVARLGGDWYAKVSSDNLFQVAKPNAKLGIGIDSLPRQIKSSRILNGNDLGKLGSFNTLPEVDTNFNDEKLISILSLDESDKNEKLQQYASYLLQRDKVEEAWQVLLRIKDN